jgi:predicted 3-demethylubiquinone-9 3-methyltransferase (glyoxalase superfamily)
MEELIMQTISTCLCFANQALQAAEFYVSIIPNSRIIDTKYYLDGAQAGSVLTVLFALDGIEHVGLNGPSFKFSPAMSLTVNCDTQEEIDNYWHKLSAGGEEGQCGWLTDKFGVSWQIVPRPFLELINTKDTAASQRAIAAMMQMKKLDIAALQRAYKG